MEREDIEKAANLVETRNVLDVLRDIPVEEINREKGGFRVKALRDHGFRSIADIVAANVYSISSVHNRGRNRRVIQFRRRNTVKAVILHL